MRTTWWGFGHEINGNTYVKNSRECQGREIKVRVVERAGQSLISLLQKTDPSPKQPCGETTCLPCNSGDLGTCRANNIVYSLKCAACDTQLGQAAPPQPPQDGQGTQVPTPTPAATLDVSPRPLDVPPRTLVPTYVGESGRNMFTRGQEHSQKLQKKDSSSAMWKHCAFAHGGDLSTPFRMKLLSKHRDPLGHVIAEGVRINHQPPESCLNSKSEFKQPKVARVALVRSLPAAQVQLGGDQFLDPASSSTRVQRDRQGSQTAMSAAAPTAPQGPTQPIVTANHGPIQHPHQGPPPPPPKIKETKWTREGKLNLQIVTKITPPSFSLDFAVS